MMFYIPEELTFLIMIFLKYCEIERKEDTFL